MSLASSPGTREGPSNSRTAAFGRDSHQPACSPRQGRALAASHCRRSLPSSGRTGFPRYPATTHLDDLLESEDQSGILLDEGFDEPMATACRKQLAEARGEEPFYDRGPATPGSAAEPLPQCRLRVTCSDGFRQATFKLPGRQGSSRGAWTN